MSDGAMGPDAVPWRRYAGENRYLAAVNHDLRNRINAVLGFAELLEQQARGTLNEHQARYVSRIRAASLDLMMDIEALTDLGRLRIGELPSDPSPFRVEELTLEITPRLEPGDSVDVSDETGAWFIDGDLDRLGLSLLRLYLDLTGPDRDVKITVRHLFDGADGLAGNRVCFRIAGELVTGSVPEFPLSTLDDVVHNDEPVDSTHPPLGLAWARRIVELHSGVIRIHGDEFETLAYEVFVPCHTNPRAMEGAGTPG